jgi:hypothetical protein
LLLPTAPGLFPWPIYSHKFLVKYIS